MLVGTILAFFAHQALGLEPATVAMTGATVMLFVSRQKLADCLAGIEWPDAPLLHRTLRDGGGARGDGSDRRGRTGIASATDGNRSAELLGITWVSAVGSGLVDNIPFTAAMIPVVESLQDEGDDAYRWALALGACFGGIGLPVTFVSMIMATAYIAGRYV